MIMQNINDIHDQLNLKDHLHPNDKPVIENDHEENNPNIHQYLNNPISYNIYKCPFIEY